MLWYLAWLGTVGSVNVHTDENVDGKKVIVNIPENINPGFRLVDVGEVFQFQGVERSFSLMEGEFIEVAEDGLVTIAKPVDYEELCQTGSLPCILKSKVTIDLSEIYFFILSLFSVLLLNFR